jgi:regulatory protein
VGSPKSADPVQQARDWLRQQAGSRAAGDGPFPDRAKHDMGSVGTDGRVEVERVRPTSRANRDQSRRGRDPRSDSSADPDADPEAVARAIVVRKLAAQDRTRHELASALAAKNVPEGVADELLDRFEEIGLIDDQAFARRWVESRQARRHRSRVALRRELAGKGLDRAVVDEAVSQVSGDDELAAAQSYVAKAVTGMSGVDPLVRRRRLADRLARRGFGADVIGRVLKDLGDE